MRLALIPPNLMFQEITKTDFHLLLPNQLKEIPQDFVATLPGYKVLDNGVAEGATSPLNLLSIMSASVNEVVAPDVMRNTEKTISGAKAMATFNSGLAKPVKIMGVVQGESISEILKCFNALYYMEWIDVIGFPRVLNMQFGMTTRVSLLESLADDPDFQGKQVHCLGAYYQWPEEVKHLRNNPIVRSVDSSLPYVLAMHELTFDDPIPNQLRRPNNYFDFIMSPYQERLAEENVERYIRWATA